MGGKASLSGSWSGDYWYGDDEEHTTFKATIIEGQGLLGTIAERFLIDTRSVELSAVMNGSRHGLKVDFIKTYVPAFGLELEPIEYAGTIGDDFSFISGIWILMSSRHVRGGFAMTRTTEGAAATARPSDLTPGQLFKGE